jgi:hypothetical protein
MDHKEALGRLVVQAQFNGFDFRRWFQMNVDASWPGMEQAIAVLAAKRRYYALLFSHEFARSFWLTGAQMSVKVPSVTYSRVNTQGDVIRVTRKPFMRRLIKRDAWKYHLRQMATADDPIAYLCRFLPANAPAVPSQNGKGRMAASA